MVVTRLLSSIYTFGVQECPICYSEYTALQAAFSKQCQHVVCMRCAVSLLIKTGSCPECRMPFKCDTDSFSVYGSLSFSQKLKSYLNWKKGTNFLVLKN